MLVYTAALKTLNYDWDTLNFNTLAAAEVCKLLILNWLKCDVYHRTPVPKTNAALRP